MPRRRARVASRECESRARARSHARVRCFRRAVVRERVTVKGSRSFAQKFASIVVADLASRSAGSTCEEHAVGLTWSTWTGVEDGRAVERRGASPVPLLTIAKPNVASTVGRPPFVPSDLRGIARTAPKPPGATGHAGRRVDHVDRTGSRRRDRRPSSLRSNDGRAPVLASSNHSLRPARCRCRRRSA